MQSPPFPGYLVPPNILLNTMFSNTLSFLSSLNVSDQVFTAKRIKAENYNVQYLGR